jgi:hypothetical protein
MSTDNTPSTVTINESARKASENGQAQGSSTKAFAGVISLLLVIAGVYAMMKPMNQNLDYMRADITKIQKVMADKCEIENQMESIKEIMLIRDTEQTKNIDRLEIRLSETLLEVARLKERLKIKSTD